MTTSDPARIQARAEMLAKAQGAERKRKRDEADSTMEVDAEGTGAGDEGDWMMSTRRRRPTKAEIECGQGSGEGETRARDKSTIIWHAGRYCAFRSSVLSCVVTDCHRSKLPRPSSSATSRNESRRGKQKRERAIAQ